MRSSSHPSSLLPPSTSTDATPSCSTSTSSSTASSSSLSLSSPSSTSSLSTIPSTYPNEDAYLQQQNKHQVYYNHPTAKGCHHEHRIYTAAGGISASSLTSTASSSPSPSLQYHNESTSASPVLPPSATSYGSNAFPPAIPYQHYQYQPGYSMATTNDGYPGATMAQLSFPSQVFVEHDTPSYMAYRSN
ncbi:hypothetical protein BC941DRAFT_435002 [Chlamydoabsidia padenii]|nr:hypothetical protein BC941DRAFT_435002 [Chlamydoabsidia padenii]